LNDYVDDLLNAEERTSVEAHVASCIACKQQLAELRELLDSAGRLGELQPQGDLFGAVRAEIAPPARSLPIARWFAVAASLVLVGWVGYQGWQGRRAAMQPAELASIESLVERFQAAEQEYREATELLVARLDDRRDELSPETLAILDRNLAIVDAAIAELVTERAQAEEGQTDIVDQKMLTALYDKKLQLLWQASRLSS
jgi:anti-sigma factor RsiW